MNDRNIFINDDDTLVIGDFGLSKPKHIIRSSTKCAGTYAYMSPECFRHGKITPLSDIWYNNKKLIIKLVLKTYFLYI